MAERRAQVGRAADRGLTVHAGAGRYRRRNDAAGLEVISQTMFHTNVADHIDHISHALRVSLKYAFDSFHSPLRVPLWVPTPRNREFRLALQFMDADSWIDRRAPPHWGAARRSLDLLQARDEETGAGLSDQELRMKR
ncbi:MAG: hypothetical protein IPM88_06020 [Nitrospira sp.]|nr:hypothetical protein [Nitrospira sp.]